LIHYEPVPRVLLLVPTSTYRAAAFLSAASQLGVDVVVGSDRQQALAGTMGESFVLVPLDDPAEATRTIVEHAAKTPLDAVVAIDDQGVVAAARASAALGLRHNPPHAAEATRDKALLRSVLATGGVPQPRHLVAGSRPGEVELAAAQVGVPVVLKPLTLSGSRGVIKVDSLDDVEETARRVREIAFGAASSSERDGRDPTENEQRILVEEYLDGPEVAVEGLLTAGELHFLAIFDKPEPLTGPYFEETMYVTPSRFEGTPLGARLRTVTEKAVHSLGLVEGPVHAELRLSKGGGDDTGPDEVRLIEVAARTIGGRCAKAVSLASGRTLEEVVLARALGIELGPDALERGPDATGVMMIPIPATGVLKDVDGVDRAGAVAGVTGIEITATIGREIRALPEGDRYLGFIFASGPSPAEVVEALSTAHGELRIEIDGSEPAPDTVTS
jgi:biotin carboxylase